MSLLGKGLALALFSSALFAQGVYVTKGKTGPIFSNVPQPGAKEVQLQPLNVIQPPEMPVEPVLPAASQPEPKAIAETATGDKETASFYRSFFVVYPENDGAVAASTAAFDVHLALDPPLQLAQQHAFVVAINGRPVDQRFTATEFMIPAEFWNDRLPPDNQLIQLDASIVNADGRTLKRAEPVQFFLRRLAFAPRPRSRALQPPRPLGMPASTEVPAPRMGQERAPAGSTAVVR